MAIRIGIISTVWLPSHGGAQQYIHRLALSLAKQEDFEVFAFCSTQEATDKDNGEFPVTRWEDGHELTRASWGNSILMPKKFPVIDIFKMYDFLDASVAWATELELDIVLISTPFQEPENHQGRELYLQLKALGIKTGALYYDISHPVQKMLFEFYERKTGNWSQAGDGVRKYLSSLLEAHNRLHTYHAIGSPLFFSPDFVISCSYWSESFIDPDDSTPKFVLHPLMEQAYWSDNSTMQESLDEVDVLMVNPRSRNNPTQMAKLINDANPQWKFRVLNGGWSDGTDFPAEFLSKIKQSAAMKEGRIDMRPYVSDMRDAYRTSNLVFFPSKIEGYGMTAVEPMYSGTPVISSNYPAILEAVGDAAYTLCPLTAPADSWRQAVDEVLNNPSEWRMKSLARADELEDRQNKELGNLVSFLNTFV
ncbi:glycosyltransferase family 4 protein [Solemya elarraichensis gill symbiont]|uniref:Glycosyl transferase family 1 domain-containing protein n=1 Tax=Solemya elarraichensis gill symbiont TaxID=1918949 RepID=A0A1T2KZG6_9GAMM|nr:glycosyltransferase [Solemya elarraichensis gill symbiont]OOZ38221.1 hypothetical protein BOW52_09015 [Solemya elarraichensis gill symbiont]